MLLSVLRETGVDRTGFADVVTDLEGGVSPVAA